jgi:hypothetical protein
VLHIVRWPVVAIRVALLLGSPLALVAVLIDVPPPLTKNEGMFVILFLLFGGVAFFISYYWGPLFAQLRPAGADEHLSPSRSFDEEYAEVFAQNPQVREDLKAAEELGEWQHEIHDRAREPWTCPSCGEENPAEFDECWKCEKDRPESTTARVE